MLKFVRMVGMIIDLEPDDPAVVQLNSVGESCEAGREDGGRRIEPGCVMYKMIVMSIVPAPFASDAAGCSDGLPGAGADGEIVSHQIGIHLGCLGTLIDGVIPG